MCVEKIKIIRSKNATQKAQRTKVRGGGGTTTRYVPRYVPEYQWYVYDNSVVQRTVNARRKDQKTSSPSLPQTSRDGFDDTDEEEGEEASSSSSSSLSFLRERRNSREKSLPKSSSSSSPSEKELEAAAEAEGGIPFLLPPPLPTYRPPLPPTSC